MKLDIKSVEQGKSIAFDDQYDLSDMEFFGLYPMQEPLRFRGEVTRRAGMRVLCGELSSRLSLVCDRCLRSYTEEKILPVEIMLALALQNEDRDDIIVCPGGICDLEQIAVPEWVLSMDYRRLCHENCRGLCEICGADLNAGFCEHKEL